MDHVLKANGKRQFVARDQGLLTNISNLVLFAVSSCAVSQEFQES